MRSQYGHTIFSIAIDGTIQREESNEWTKGPSSLTSSLDLTKGPSSLTSSLDLTACRYRTRLRVGGEAAVRREMAVDMARLWRRNLGRDDRCLSDHGREARFPFLDESVVSYLATLPLSLLADLSLPPGEGDKMLLREVAASLGLHGASCEVKRAIQFGTRIAKQSNKETFGSNRKASGTARVAVLASAPA